MAKPRTGYSFQRKDGSWWARVTFVDSSGKRRDLQRRRVGAGARGHDRRP